ncbi:MAG TPA: endolytic transglycosylase MltG [Candidatus Paceibacterota bacterium]|jgi:conserved hypothetical protein, YceG family
MDNNDRLRYIPEPEHHELLPEHVLQESGESNGVPPQKYLHHTVLAVIGACAVFVVALIAMFTISVPPQFPKDTLLTVSQGTTLSGVAQLLYERGAIRSVFAFKALSAVFGGTKGMKAGDYYLNKPETVISMAWRFTHSKYDLQNIRITIPEGTNVAEIAELFQKEPKFAHFDSVEFVKLAAPFEGYLFPDTYLFLPNISAQDVIDAMRSNFDKRVATLQADIETFGKPMKDVINMASIIEEEARTEETRRTIAGILWKRLGNGWPLQVDAAFEFVNGKRKSSELSAEDLKIDSPYNTYTHKDLPPTPISNPGLNAISATVRPIATKYFFYLSDDDGNMHYAVTNAEHEANKAKYLK